MTSCERIGIDLVHSTWSTEIVWGKAFTFAVAASIGPQDFVACATCAADVTQAVVVANEKYTPVPSVPGSASARAKSTGPSRVELRPGDVLEEEDGEHVRAIRHATTPVTWTRFKPGAISPHDANWVWGEVER